MYLEKLKNQMLEQGYLHSAEYARIHGLSKAQIESRLQSQQIEYKKVGQLRFVKVDAQPANYIDRQAYLTVPEYAARNNISATRVNKLVKQGKLECKTIGTRAYIHGDITLIKEVKTYPSGKQLAYWKQAPKSQPTVFS